MSAAHSRPASTLPALLKEYEPGYEPSDLRADGRAQPGRGRPVDRAASPGGRKPRGSGRKRERSRDLMIQKAEIEKNERFFNHWQNAKADVRDEETERLREKISLQQQLISAQDELHSAQEAERRAVEAKRREDERAAKRAREDELLKICRQSLDEDRERRREEKAGVAGSRDRSAATTRHSQDTAGAHGHPPAMASVSGRHESSSASPQTRHTTTSSPGTKQQSPASEEHHDGDPGPLRLPTYVAETTQTSMGAPWVAPVLTPQPSNLDDFTLREEEEEDAQQTREATQIELESGDPLPWHHQQLYALYGDEDADYFLHPKMEPEKKAAVKPLNPKLRKSADHMGAGELWEALRDESFNRLISEDGRIPTELKHAYSAFVRQCLARRKRPVKRNFYQTEDVPEMELLLDRRRLRAANEYRHKMALMFRASLMNQDKNSVLMFNNPPPDLNNWAGEESVQRYIPTWAEQGQDTASIHGSFSRASSMQSAGDRGSLPPGQASARRGGAASETPRQSLSVRGPASMVAESASPRQPEQGRSKVKVTGLKESIVFLTEKQARVPGEFSKRRRELAEAKSKPPAHGGIVTDSNAPRSPDGSGRGSSRGQSPRQHGSGGEAVAGAWQPLSLSALAEYRDQKAALGAGRFSNGRMPVWSVQ